MKYFIRQLFFLSCFFFASGLSAAHADQFCALTDQAKLYLDPTDLEIADNAIYIHLENTLIETGVIRTDQYGCYIFENDITCEIAREKKKEWKCPYCNYWWPIGQKCKNGGCPTNQW